MDNTARKETVVTDIPFCPPGLHLSCLREIQEGNMSEVDQSQILTMLTRIMDKLDGTNGTAGVMTRMREAETAILDIREDVKDIKDCLRQMDVEEKEREKGILVKAKEVRDERRNSWWYRILFGAATTLVTITLTVLFQTYVNRAPSKVDREIAGQVEAKTEAEVKEKKAAEERFANIEKVLTTIAERLPERGGGERGGGGRGKGKNMPASSKPAPPLEPQRVNRLHEDVTADKFSVIYGSARLASRILKGGSNGL